MIINENSERKKPEELLWEYERLTKDLEIELLEIKIKKLELEKQLHKLRGNY